MVLEIALSRVVKTISGAIGKKKSVVEPFRWVDRVDVVVTGLIGPGIGKETLVFVLMIQ